MRQQCNFVLRPFALLLLAAAAAAAFLPQVSDSHRPPLGFHFPGPPSSIGLSYPLATFLSSGAPHFSDVEFFSLTVSAVPPTSGQNPFDSDGFI